MTAHDETERPPQRPLPPESCPSPVDALPVSLHGLAYDMAKRAAIEKRASSDACASIFRETQNALPGVVEAILSWSDAKITEEVAAFERRQREAREERLRAAELARRGRIAR